METETDLYKDHMNTPERIHNAVIGTLICLFAALAYFASPWWLLALAGLGVLMILGAIVGYCPLYATLKKRDANQN